MLALTALAAATEEQRAQVQSITLTATPPSYQQLVSDRQQRVRDHHFAQSYSNELGPMMTCHLEGSLFLHSCCATGAASTDGRCATPYSI